MASLQLNFKSLRAPFRHHNASLPKQCPPEVGRIRCGASTPTRRYSITLLPGDGIGPEVISVAKGVLSLAGSLEDPWYMSSEYCQLSSDYEIKRDELTKLDFSWTAGKLSYAGRLQLIKSVAFSLDARVGSRVSWDFVCLPKQEGGLGLH